MENNFKAGHEHHILINILEPHKIYILAVVDECMVVYKYFGKHKKWWHYNIDHKDILDVKIHTAKVKRDDH